MKSQNSPYPIIAELIKDKNLPLCPAPKRLSRALVKQAVETANELLSLKRLTLGNFATKTNVTVCVLKAKKNRPFTVITSNVERHCIAIIRKRFDQLSIHSKRFWILWAVMRPVFKSDDLCDKHALLALLDNYNFKRRALGFDFIQTLEINPSSENVLRVQQMAEILCQPEAKLFR